MQTGFMGRHLLCAAWLLATLSGGTAHAADALDAWRAEVRSVRTLADNDVPLAYARARQLQASLPSDAPAADRALALNLLSRTETYLGLTGPASSHAQQAFDLAARNGDRVGQAEADLNVALNSINEGRLDALVTATTHSVTVLEGVDRPDLLGEALLRTTVMYRRFDQFEESVLVAVQAMEIARRSNNPLALAYAHHGQAIAFDQSYRISQSREHYLQMRIQARAAHSRLLEAFATAGLAGQAVSDGDLHAGEQFSREAIAMLHEVGAPFAECFAKYSLADNLAKQGRLAEAMRLLDETLQVYDKLPNRIGLWFSLNARSALFQTQGNIAAARADAERGYALAKDLKLAIYTSGSALRMAAIEAAAGDHRRAYELSLEARDMTNKAAREKASARMQQLIQRYESESKQRQIDELTRRNLQQTAELQQRTLQQRWLLTVLIGSVAVLAVSALFLRRLRRSHRVLAALNSQLQRSRDAVRALNAGLEQRVLDRTAELRQQKRYLRTLIDMLPMWAWFKDTGHRYLVTNQAHAKARGHDADEMIGQADADLLPPPQAEAALADDAQVMASRERRTAEVQVTQADGTVWMETYQAPVIDDDGSLLGTVGVARDISERKEAEAAREAALEEARRLARLRSDFLARMSHELRAPLNAILGFTQNLLDDRELGERATRNVAIIRQSGEHLLALINDVLDLARIDAGRIELHPEPVDLMQCLQVVTDIIRVKADEKGLSFGVVRAPGLPGAVRVDELRLRQVLLNLLSNAVKFTDTGQLTLRVSPASSAPAQVRLRFEVEDSGVGMSEAQMTRIFEPFEQVGEARRRSAGAGLGLAISRQLVNLMGGEIQVRSREGRGSVFWFELELAVCGGAVAPLPANTRIIGYAGPRRRVLVVDDAPILREMLTQVLHAAGFQTAQAGDGAQGIELASRWGPDLIVMDLTMPVMDGLQALRQIRKMPALARIPVLAASAGAMPETEVNALAAGASAFIAKPVVASVLLQRVGDLLALELIFGTKPPDAADASTTVPHGADSGFVVPSAQEIEVLHGLARVGSMRDVLARAQHLESLDPSYAPFAARLRGLAENYQSQALMELLDSHRASPADTP